MDLREEDLDVGPAENASIAVSLFSDLHFDLRLARFVLLYFE
jgi:hypothetical protein